MRFRFVYYTYICVFTMESLTEQIIMKNNLTLPRQIYIHVALREPQENFHYSERIKTE